jgi:5-methyltetrahydrofolate--homocysteine methyltransferase
VVGTIDEDKLQAQAFTRERKLAVAQRSVKLLTEKYGIAPEDIIIDPLVFPCATGDENYIGGAVETIEAIRLIKEKIPFVKTILGVSNISFGLPASAREVVNSVFLYYAPRPAWIWRSSTPRSWSASPRFPEKSGGWRRICCSTRRRRQASHADCARARGLARADPRAENRRSISSTSPRSPSISADRHQEEKEGAADLPLDERLANYIIEGTKDGLIPTWTASAPRAWAPLDIINGPLMAGHDRSRPAVQQQ